ncbi:phenylpropionate dioxygenase-like ring-hydroxylating dioxygenase large terminal subunit [Novosphingobium chloroacetimidivorans]|uniref:Phenylpropionate dioxygenase-like ring-hydroxylating dioxygenase large terminal subunit n=1 Tax=Novosphingobium chloroacetimidivorans TaxID=1428314 RepID=A0A7W7KDB3_9SPHN|nr:Rieske 2Fe-2S domain-containing protein [Novosphingobium chloroacetimidivorans]MBB4860311.1 phenylpropionate dioxygenase-like ring-hydroxylating dioxygenase large terminal subunit [Novosphingobium chloroacetimidivorans]
MTVATSARDASGADLDPASLVEAERVHRRAYVDPEIFELEMDLIFGRSWIYVGHESQIPQAGDYFTTQVGRQPVIMTRHTDGQIYVLENRCPHKGALVCPERAGHSRPFVCMYHGWSFDGDGALRSVPARSGYEGTSFDPKDPANGLKQLPRVQNHRGFIFASLAADGPDFKTWAGKGLRGLDNLVDRAPAGEVEVIGDCYRTVQNNNWKIFLDNMSDGMHTSFVHNQMAKAAQKTIARTAVRRPGGLDVAAMLAGEPEQMARMDLVAHPGGHFDMVAFAPPPSGPDADQYKASMEAFHGKERAEAILKESYHSVLMFPTLVMQQSLQQMRVIRPISANKTLLEIWVFCLKGAPESFVRRAVTGGNVGNSPSNVVAADDFESYYRVHAGLESPQTDWVLLHRGARQDVPQGSSIKGGDGNSEVCMRNMFHAWRDYMTAQ